MDTINITELNIDSVLKIMGIVFPIVTAYLGGKNHQKTEEIKIMRTLVANRKNKAYTEMTHFFFTILKGAINNTTHNPKDSFDEIMKSKEKILMYGSDRVIRAFNRFLSIKGYGQKNALQKIDSFLTLMVELRHDIYGHKTRITKLDILESIMQDRGQAIELLRKAGVYYWGSSEWRRNLFSNNAIR